MTAFTVIEIATGIFQKLSLGKASNVPEVTENSRRPSEHLTCDHVPRCRMRADWFAIGLDQRNWQQGFIFVNLDEAPDVKPGIRGY
ncbi:hypothetical protein NKJ90_27175 [Mesorhizobium sp. M0051]|uniref:hypothetical protein n=1 Tax=Mesorhizobium sp. M0051 TaxID=2956862 RepID=UPI003337424F